MADQNDDQLGAPRPGAFLSFQQLFDKALLGVRRQGGPSINEYGQCAYRSPGGERACGVGHLIPDNVYDAIFDEAQDHDTTVGVMLQCRPDFVQALAAGGVDVNAPLMVDFLVSLQGAHDAAAGPNHNPRTGRYFLESFEYAMGQVARRYGLTYTAPEAS